MTVPALSQYDWDVGVEVDDTFRYVGTLVLWESDSVEFPPMYIEWLQTYNESDWMEYTVTDIEAENVTFEVTTHWTNGTETVATMEENMTSSQGIMVIGANLTEGTEIREAWTDPTWGIEYAARILDAPVMREYESGPKETNVLIYDQDIFGNIFHYEYLFDKETGIRVYYQNSGIDVLDMNQNMYSYNATLELIETNVADWVVPDLTGPIMLLMLIAITIPIVLHKRKTLKH
ncbi:MAG: hypothetical protein IBV52_06360 [Candidatus Bathyarchaeota archaeon]